MCLRFLWVKRCAAAFCTNFSQAITEALTSTGKKSAVIQPNGTKGLDENPDQSEWASFWSSAFHEKR